MAENKTYSFGLYAEIESDKQGHHVYNQVTGMLVKDFSWGEWKAAVACAEEIKNHYNALAKSCGMK